MPRLSNQATGTTPQAAHEDPLYGPSPIVRGDPLSRLPGVTHGLTRRVAGFGLADGNIGFGAPRDPNDAWMMRRQWCQWAEVDPESMVTVRQVHGAEVMVAKAEDAGRGARPGSDPVGTADALITADPGVVLITLHADCLPILLCDPTTPAIASVHAGWRGTTLDVAGATVAAMERQFGSQPRNMRAYLGASIGACCYEVGVEVVDAWRQQANDEADTALRWNGAKWLLDLRAANRLLLLRAGLRADLIELSAVCTRCQSDEWFSHRGQGANTGRFGALIALREGG